MHFAAEYLLFAVKFLAPLLGPRELPKMPRLCLQESVFLALLRSAACGPQLRVYLAALHA